MLNLEDLPSLWRHPAKIDLDFYSSIVLATNMLNLERVEQGAVSILTCRTFCLTWSCVVLHVSLAKQYICQPVSIFRQANSTASKLGYAPFLGLTVSS